MIFTTPPMIENAWTVRTLWMTVLLAPATCAQLEMGSVDL
jgi:hypothetical protein